MALNEGPFATYADVTGVVDATAAAEVVVLIAALKALFDVADGESAASPEFARIDRPTRELLVGEIDGMAAAIAAAPTV